MRNVIIPVLFILAITAISTTASAASCTNTQLKGTGEITVLHTSSAVPTWFSASHARNSPFANTPFAIVLQHNIATVWNYQTFMRAKMTTPLAVFSVNGTDGTYFVNGFNPLIATTGNITVVSQSSYNC